VLFVLMFRCRCRRTLLATDWETLFALVFDCRCRRTSIVGHGDMSGCLLMLLQSALGGKASIA
jgi:hypothetical protein